MLGTMDYENKKFEHDAYRTLDYGFDFYAPQVMECGTEKNSVCMVCYSGFAREKKWRTDGGIY